MEKLNKLIKSYRFPLIFSLLIVVTLSFYFNTAIKSKAHFYMFYAIHTHSSPDTLPYDANDGTDCLAQTGIEFKNICTLNETKLNNMLSIIEGMKEVFDKHNFKASWQVTIGPAHAFCNYQGKEDNIFKQLYDEGHSIGVHAHDVEDLPYAYQYLKEDCGIPEIKVGSGFNAWCDRSCYGDEIRQAISEGMKTLIDLGITTSVPFVQAEDAEELSEKDQAFIAQAYEVTELMTTIEVPDQSTSDSLANASSRNINDTGVALWWNTDSIPSKCRIRVTNKGKKPYGYCVQFYPQREYSNYYGDGLWEEIHEVISNEEQNISLKISSGNISITYKLIYLPANFEMELVHYQTVTGRSLYNVNDGEVVDEKLKYNLYEINDVQSPIGSRDTNSSTGITFPAEDEDKVYLLQVIKQEDNGGNVTWFKLNSLNEEEVEEESPTNDFLDIIPPTHYEWLTIHGRVESDSTHTPIKGALITIDSKEEENGINILADSAPAYSNDSGEFTIQFQIEGEGTAKIKLGASVEGYLEQTTTVTIDSTDEDQSISGFELDEE